jgi:hypothetical protein
VEREREKLFWWHSHKETGRLWLHFPKLCIGLEFSRPSFRFGFGLNDSRDNHIHGSFLGFYWHIECWALAKRMPRVEHSFRFYWHDWGLWLSLWGNDWCSSWNDPWWSRMHHVDFRDLFAGKQEYSKVVNETFENVVIPMPDKNYCATMQFETATWKRPRWFPRVRKFTNIEIKENPPAFPGKGENSWDCGDDAIYMMSVEGHSLAKGIGGYVQAVMENREKYGGRKSLIAKT